MKINKIIKKLVFILMLISGINVYALNNEQDLKIDIEFSSTVSGAGKLGLMMDGSETGNGGDPLEQKFTEIAVNIKGWIKAGNFLSLNFPEGITNEKYSENMILVINQYSVSFTDKPIIVSGVNKVCKNFWESENSPKILCSLDFKNLIVEDQYRLVHHELAGLAGLEENDNSKSDYSISEQISAYLRTETVKRLPIVPTQVDFQSEISGGPSFSAGNGKTFNGRLLTIGRNWPLIKKESEGIIYFSNQFGYDPNEILLVPNPGGFKIYTRFFIAKEPTNIEKFNLFLLESYPNTVAVVSKVGSFTFPTRFFDYRYGDDVTFVYGHRKYIVFNKYLRSGFSASLTLRVESDRSLLCAPNVGSHRYSKIVGFSWEDIIVFQHPTGSYATIDLREKKFNTCQIN